MARFCANCGTEVDDTAVFCPTCGQPIDQATETEMPAAPAWPEPPSPRTEPTPDEAGEPHADRAWAATGQPSDEPTRVEPQQPPPAPPPAAVPPPRQTDAARPESPPMKLPLTMPLTISAWLIGVGAAVAALGVLIGLFEGVLNPIELLLLLALIGIAATVFLSASLPAIPHVRLATLAIVLIAFGMALDRLSFGVAGIGELLLFLGAAAAAIGAIILELGRDQPIGGAAR